MVVTGGQLERYLRYAGLIRLDMIDPIDAVRILCPEVIMLAVSISVLILCRVLTYRDNTDDDHLLPVVNSPTPEAQQITQRRRYSLLTIIGRFKDDLLLERLESGFPFCASVRLIIHL